MDRHIEWFDTIYRCGKRLYYPIPDMLVIDPLVKSYTTGGDEGHLYIVKVPDDDSIKIGSTTQLIIRMYYYPRGTELLYCKKVDSRLRELEKRWIGCIKKDDRFKLAHGREWFIGPWKIAVELLDTMLGEDQ